MGYKKIIKKGYKKGLKKRLPILGPGPGPGPGPLVRTWSQSYKGNKTTAPRLDFGISVVWWPVAQSLRKCMLLRQKKGTYCIMWERAGRLRGCPYRGNPFWEIWVWYLIFQISSELFETLVVQHTLLFDMYRPKCYYKTDRMDRGIILRFQDTNHFVGDTLPKQNQVSFPLFKLPYNW